MKRTNEEPGKGKRPNKAAGWAVLTWDDLDRWAGSRSVSRGRSYQNQGRVKDLAISADDRLLATVQGGDRYVVSVWLNAGKKRHDKIESHCTCPVGYNCKHAVATVAAYLQALTEGATVPTADPDDPRWRKLSDADAEFEEDLDDWDDDDDQEDDEEAEPADGAADTPSRRRDGLAPSGTTRSSGLFAARAGKSWPKRSSRLSGATRNCVKSTGNESP